MKRIGILAGAFVAPIFLLGCNKININSSAEAPAHLPGIITCVTEQAATVKTDLSGSDGAG